jgi:hypothetical protein
VQFGKSSLAPMCPMLTKFFQCLQDAMAVFAQYANNVSQPISKTYGTAAQQLSISCGRTFVNVTAAPLKAAAPTTSASLTPTLTLIIMFILFFFQ